MLDGLILGCIGTAFIQSIETKSASIDVKSCFTMGSSRQLNIYMVQGILIGTL